MLEVDRVRAVVREVAFPGYTFDVVDLRPDTGSAAVGMDWGYSPYRVAIQVRYNEPDVMTGVVEEQRGRLWVINDGWQDGQIIQTCFKALLTSLEHRAREHFLWRGRPILQPHLKPQQLWQLAAAHTQPAQPLAFTTPVE